MKTIETTHGSYLEAMEIALENKLKNDKEALDLFKEYTEQVNDLIPYDVLEEETRIDFEASSLVYKAFKKLNTRRIWKN